MLSATLAEIEYTLSEVISVPRKQGESRANTKNSISLNMRELNADQQQLLPSPSGRRGLHFTKESKGHITVIKKVGKESQIKSPTINVILSETKHDPLNHQHFYRLLQLFTLRLS